MLVSLSLNLINNFRKLQKYISLGRFGMRHPSQIFFLLKIRRSRLTYLNTWALADLTRAVWEIENLGIRGQIIEAGCAMGGSALAITAAKAQNRPFFVYDTFAQIPPPTSKDGNDAHQRYQQIDSGQAPGIQGDTYYGYLPNLKEQVSLNFMRFGYSIDKNQVKLVQGMFQDTLKVNDPVALAHIDCDWYDSVMVCLKQIVPHLSSGGILVIDDYSDWSGCRRAIDEFFAGQKERFSFDFRTKLQIRRIG